MSGMFWMAVCAAAIFALGQAASAAEPLRLHSGQPWRAVEQPELKHALEKAPVLRTESLGTPSRGVLSWKHALVPNLDGKTWDVLQWYFKDYRGPTWLHAIDLGTGRVKRQRFRDNVQIHMSGEALGFDGKYYITTTESGMLLSVYDPATNMLEDRGVIVPDLGGMVRPIVFGPDGRLYGTGTTYDEHKVGLYIYDPKLRKVVKNFRGVGPSHASVAISRAIGVDDTHAYLLSGDYLDFVRGPDGFAWTYLKNVLVRINPKDASVHVVGKIDPPGRPIFVGNDLYLAGLTQLRRIRNIVPAPQLRDRSGYRGESHIVGGPPGGFALR